MQEVTSTPVLPLGFEQADIKLEPYEPFGFRSKEDTSVGRFFFINRKADRFTLNCNYRECGVNLNGKKYGRFKKLFSFSVTLREPKTVGQMSMNVFYQGNIGGHKYKVLNITRNPSLVLGAFPSELNTFIVKEILQLVQRQNLYPVEQFKQLEKQIFDELNSEAFSSKVAIQLISRVAFPMLENTLNTDDKVLCLASLKIRNNDYETLVAPTFVMPLIRNNNIESLMNGLSILKENREYFTDNITKWNVDALYFLSISRGLVDAPTQKRILDIFATNTNPSYKVTAHSWDENLTGFYIPRLRQVIKTLNKESRNKVLLDAQIVDYFPKLIKLWSRRSKFEKRFKIDKPINSVQELYYELTEELAERKIETNTIKSGAINALLNDLTDGVIFDVENTFSGSQISGGYGSMKLWLPADAQESGSYGSWFYYSEVDRESKLWKPIFEDEYFISSPVEASGFTKRPQHNSANEVPIIFSPKIYLKFLENLKELTLQEMKKQKIEDTQTNRAFTSLMIMLFSSYANFRKYQPMPRKIFTLYKAGLHPVVIDYALKHKKAANTVKEYAGLPLEWVEKLIGVKEGTFVRRTESF